MASLRGLAREVGVPYSSFHHTVERLLGVRPGLITSIDHSRPSLINGGHVYTVLKSIVLLARRRLAYYTMPPIPLWPWLLAPMKSIDVLEDLLERMREVGARPSSVILDVGIMDWLSMRKRGYDERFWAALWSSVYRLRGLARRYGFQWRVVMPDVPATVPNNVEETMRLQERLLEEHPDLPWIPVAQASKDRPHTVHLQWLIEAGIVERYGVAALGSLKVLAGRQKRVWLEAIEAARSLLEEHSLDVRLHVFGAPLDVAASSKSLAPGSWDSKTWTYPRVPHIWSAKDMGERIVFFTAFLERLVELLLGKK